jgi:hypothetical protein
LITSQEEHDINASLDTQLNIMKHELSVTNDSNKDDVVIFLHNEMGSIRNYHGLPLDWPGEVKVHNMVAHSAGLFIWASLATNLIRTAYDPKKKLEVLLQGSAHGTAESVLDALYATALHAAGQWDDDDFVADFQCILGVVLTSRTSLSDKSIDHLLQLHKQRLSKGLLSRLQCLLIWRPGWPVNLLHASFADYLINPPRSGNQPWFINTNVAHDTLAHGCLQLMNAELHFNMCELETSHLRNEDVPGLSQQIAKAIPPHLAYACQFWADHIHAAPWSNIFKSNLEDFMFNKLLYWLECLSFLEKVAIASPALLQMEMWGRVSESILCYLSQNTHVLHTRQIIQMLT